MNFSRLSIFILMIFIFSSFYARKGLSEREQRVLNEEFLVAALTHNFDVVKRLLEEGIDINVTVSEGGQTALLLAIDSGDLEMVNFLIGNGANVNLPGGFYEETPLIRAAQLGNIEIIKILLKHKANINLVDKNHTTPLMRALQIGDFEIVKLLIKAGAKVNVADRGLITPLIIAIGRGQIDMVKFLLEKGAIINAAAMAFAARRGNFKIVQLLLDHSGRPDVNDMGFGNNALMEAVIGGHKKIVRLLLDKDARINLANDLGWTPLMFAVEMGHSPLVRLLLSEGADINLMNDRGETALDIAVGSFLASPRIIGFPPIDRAALAHGRDSSLSLILNQMGEILKKAPNPELKESFDATIESALKKIDSRRANSILRIFHIFARNYHNQFPDLEKKVDLIIARRGEGALRKAVEHYRASR